MATKQSQTRKRTVSKELHEMWLKLERKNDAKVIAELLGVSKPTIDNALIYGCVHQQVLVDGITKFFADRLMKEKEDAFMLQGLQNDIKQAVA